MITFHIIYIIVIDKTAHVLSMLCYSLISHCTVDLQFTEKFFSSCAMYFLWSSILKFSWFPDVWSSTSISLQPQ